MTNEQPHSNQEGLSRREQQEANQRAELDALMTDKKLDARTKYKFKSADPATALFVMKEIDEQAKDGAIKPDNIRHVRDELSVDQAEKWLLANRFRDEIAVSLEEAGAPKRLRDKASEQFQNPDAVEGATEMERILKEWKSKQEKKDKRQAKAILSQLDSDDTIV
jgi:hypothetical protein